MRGALKIVALASLTVLALARAGEASGYAHAPASQRPCARIYWRTFDDRDKRCPAHLHVIADLDYWHLQWSRWTRDGATGHGVEVQFDDADPPPPGSSSARPGDAATDDGSTVG